MAAFRIRQNCCPCGRNLEIGESAVGCIAHRHRRAIQADGIDRRVAVAEQLVRRIDGVARLRGPDVAHAGRAGGAAVMAAAWGLPASRSCVCRTISTRSSMPAARRASSCGPLDDDRAAQTHQHLRLHLAVHMRVVPVEPFRHVRRHVVVIGEAPLPATRRDRWRVGADRQHVILGLDRRHGEAMHVKVGGPGCRWCMPGTTG